MLYPFLICPVCTFFVKLKIETLKCARGVVCISLAALAIDQLLPVQTDGVLCIWYGILKRYLDKVRG